jgi:hypothetical protein
MRMTWKMPWIVLLGLLLASAGSAVTSFQQDDFTASTDGWQRGSAALGGPGGASDGFLLFSSDGSSTNGKLVTFNQNQWSGNYLDAGVGAVDIYMRNLGQTDLQMRVALGTSPAPTFGGTWFASTQPVSLPAGAFWQLFVFPLGSADLTRVQGSASYDTVMSGVATLRILDSAAPSAFGDNVVASLGIDRIVAVPEPASALLVSAGLLILARPGRTRAARPKTANASGTGKVETRA